MNVGCSGSDLSFHLIAETVSYARIILEKLMLLKLTLPWVVLHSGKSVGGAKFAIKWEIALTTFTSCSMFFIN